MDSEALNYNPNANEDDGSCIAFAYGCTDPTAFNYDSNANTDDGSCVPFVYGCIDPVALNFDADANVDDGSCVEIVLGCMDSEALNYNPNANTDNGLCEFAGCTNEDADNYDANATIDDGSCIIVGCTINAWFICPESYNPDATVNDWSMCVFTWNGCATTALALPSFDEYPTIKLSDITNDIIDAYYYLGEDRVGCMDKLASNYLETAVLDDESCMYSLDVQTLNTENIISIYPQPATSYVIIDFKGLKNTGNEEINIHNIVGEKIHTVRAAAGGVIQINTNNWTTGIYYVVIKVENKNLTHRFVIE